MFNKLKKKGENMRKVKREETNMSGKQVLGGLLVGFAVIDFAASWGSVVRCFEKGQYVKHFTSS